jgi:drug/metabolite transporter (DMT)-like permease
MQLSHIITAALIALGFVSWAIIGKYSQASGAWVGTVVMLETGLVVALMSKNQLTAPLPTVKALVILSVGAIANGLAVVYYAAKITDTAIPTGVFVVFVVVFMAMLAPLLDWLLNGQMPTLHQAAGFFFVIIGIYLMGR